MIHSKETLISGKMTPSCLRQGWRNTYSFYVSGFRFNLKKESIAVQLNHNSFEQTHRNMASGRNHFVSKGSKKVSRTLTNVIKDSKTNAGVIDPNYVISGA